MNGGRERILNFLILFLFVTFAVSSCRNSPEYYLSQGEVFHTSFHIKYRHNKLLGDEIRAVLDSFDLSLNPFNKESVIYKVNNNRPVEVDRYFATVFDKAQEVSEASDGAFDVTCAPLVNLWGFGFNESDSVTPQMVDSLKSFVGYRKIRLENNRIIKEDPRVILNMSAIAKGYSCDVVAGLLDSYGIEDYMVEIGGEVRVKGQNPNGVCWKIEITRPDDDRSGLRKERLEVVELCNRSMATSGNYRNYYIRDGKKYAHTIDPRTGYPAENEMLSATVIAGDCMTADAYATAFMTLGLDEACKLADDLPELDYIFVYSDREGVMKIIRSKGLSDYSRYK
ncbi:MAG: FAD:protein FMN transferase [Dysgonamonadaceae bacterium]|nr:FAD:protein FMN transferase [Dysgonamonadaceae bacterium]